MLFHTLQKLRWFYEVGNMMMINQSYKYCGLRGQEPLLVHVIGQLDPS